jgi:hypothetical protein
MDVSSRPGPSGACLRPRSLACLSCSPVCSAPLQCWRPRPCTARRASRPSSTPPPRSSAFARPFSQAKVGREPRVTTEARPVRLLPQEEQADEATGPTGNGEECELSTGWRGTNMTDEESFRYHYGKWGKGVSPQQYAEDAGAWARAPSGTSTSVELKDGSPGIRWRTPGGGVGGILDLNGNIITCWYH